VVTFTTPFTTPETYTIELENPILGDAENLDIKVQYRESMSGLLRSYISTPELEILNLTFNSLTEAKKDELVTFLMYASGNRVQYTDYKSTVWLGVLTSNPIEIATVNQHFYNVTIEFRGRAS